VSFAVSFTGYYAEYEGALGSWIDGDRLHDVGDDQDL